MSLDSHPALKRFFSTILMDTDAERDSETVRNHCNDPSRADIPGILADLRSLLDLNELPLDEFGVEANRWFGDQEEARAWLESIRSIFESASGAGDAVVVLDSNGSPLLEGDAVTVIKDLKVKGGSSDLKRGTLIRKIHLTPDPELVECKVDGSVLVLRTEFLKKS